MPEKRHWMVDCLVVRMEKVITYIQAILSSGSYQQVFQELIDYLPI